MPECTLKCKKKAAGKHVIWCFWPLFHELFIVYQKCIVDIIAVSLLIGGKDPQVQTAGMITFTNGKISTVDNQSGHYRPNIQSIAKVESALQKLYESNPNLFDKNSMEEKVMKELNKIQAVTAYLFGCDYNDPTFDDASTEHKDAAEA